MYFIGNFEIILNFDHLNNYVYFVFNDKSKNTPKYRKYTKSFLRKAALNSFTKLDIVFGADLRQCQ